MKIELEKSRRKKMRHIEARHPHVRGRYVEFHVGIMPPQESTPSEGDDSRAEDQAEVDNFQDATEGPETNGDGEQKPREQASETPQGETDHKRAEDGEHQQEEQLGRPERGRAALPTRDKKAEPEEKDGRDLNIDVHPEPPMEEPSDSDSGEGDDAEWNPVCVACLRVYSRDPDLTITLVSPDDKGGASNLVRGREPAGATM